MRLLQRIADSGEKNIQFGGFWWNILICDGILKRLTHYRSWRNPSNCRYFHYQEIGLLIMSRGPRLAFHFQCGGWDVHPEKVTVGVENLCMSTFNTGEELSLDTISLVSFLYHFEALSLTASLRQYAVFKNVPQMPDYSKISVSEVSHLLKRSHTHYYYFSLTSFFFFFLHLPPSLIISDGQFPRLALIILKTEAPLNSWADRKEKKNEMTGCVWNHFVKTVFHPPPLRSDGFGRCLVGSADSRGGRDQSPEPRGENKDNQSLPEKLWWVCLCGNSTIFVEVWHLKNPEFLSFISPRIFFFCTFQLISIQMEGNKTEVWHGGRFLWIAAPFQSLPGKPSVLLSHLLSCRRQCSQSTTDTEWENWIPCWGSGSTDRLSSPLKKLNPTSNLVPRYQISN